MYKFTNNEDRTWEYFSGLAPDNQAATWSTLVNWTEWDKSLALNCQFLDVLMIGAGGGGGGGFTKTVGGNGGGGGGGGGAGIVRARFILALLPDVLYFYIPNGGKGGAANTAGSPGPRAAMALVPGIPNDGNNGMFVTVLQSGGTNTTGSQPGGAGTNIAVGAGGAGCTVANYATTPSSTHGGLWSCLAITLSATAGPAGKNGGSQLGAVGTNEVDVTFMVSGGAGGAGSGSSLAAAAGGDITARGVFDTITGSTAPADAPGGVEHYDSPFYGFCSVGGAGGGSTNTAATVGGAGGTGGFGSGGGGGGAGVSAGGRGGDGGSAYLFLVAS